MMCGKVSHSVSYFTSDTVPMVLSVIGWLSDPYIEVTTAEVITQLLSLMSEKHSRLCHL